MRRLTSLVATFALLLVLPLSAAAQETLVPGRNLFRAANGTASTPTRTYEADRCLGSFRKVVGEEAFTAGCVERWSFNSTRILSTIPIQLPAGTASAVSVAVGAANTGLMRPAADYLGFVTGGVRQWDIDNGGNLVSVVSDNNINVGQHAYIGAQLRVAEQVIFSAFGDGVGLLRDSAGTSWNRLLLGGVTGGFPAVKRNGAGISIRTADDAALSHLTASRVFSEDGTATAPGFSFAGDTTRGLFRSGGSLRTSSDDVTFTAGGGLPYAQLYDNTFKLGAAGTLSVVLERDGDSILALKNSTNPQTFRVYGNATDIGFLDWSGSNFRIGATYTGAGSYRGVRIVTGGAERWDIAATTGHLTALGAYTVETSGMFTARAGSPSFPASGIGIEMYYSASNDLGYLYAYNRTTPGYKNISIPGGSLMVGTETSAGVGYITASTGFGVLNAALLSAIGSDSLMLRDWAATGFGRLAFGGSTSAFPAVKRNNADIRARLADDTADTGMIAGVFYSTSAVYAFDLSASLRISVGAGAPEGVVVASVGSLYLRTGGGAGTTLYVKESGAGDTGWVAK